MKESINIKMLPIIQLTLRSSQQHSRRFQVNFYLFATILRLLMISRVPHLGGNREQFSGKQIGWRRGRDSTYPKFLKLLISGDISLKYA